MSVIRALINFLRRWFMHLFEGRTLEDKRKRYKFAQVASLPGMNVQNGTPDIPFDETPSVSWLAKVVKVLLRTIEGDPFASGSAVEDLAKAADAPAAMTVELLDKALSDLADERTAAHATASWPQDKAGYDALFSPNKVPLPSIASNFTPTPQNKGHFDDDFFANLRTAGFNPMVITGVSTVPAIFSGLTDTMYQHAVGAGFGSDTLAAAAADGRLYVCDYSAITDLVAAQPDLGGAFPHNQQKYINTPHALFVLPPNATPASPAALRPVAIRMDANGPIFYPNDPADINDGEAWTQAKYAVNSADGNYHELISHLGWTHLVIEPFAVCTQRNLREKHELYRLLVPHFEGTIFINNAAAGKLINNGGQINQLLAPEIGDAQKFAVTARGINASGLFDFNQQFVPVELARRSVTDPRLLFPYRDDATRIWDVLASWVGDYVDVFYGNDRHVQGDVELQNWASELVSPTGGQIQGFGDATNGSKVITTKAYLKDALTMIIFTASAQHAAVNFAQAAIMTYSPAVPLAMYQSQSTAIPTSVQTYSPDGSTPGLLPPDSIAKLQLDLLALLGGVYYTQLGQYGDGYFSNGQVKAALSQLHSNLEGVSQQIKTANKTRPLDYPYLLPQQIPQSINI